MLRLQFLTEKLKPEGGILTFKELKNGGESLI